ncbi:MAG: bis(5'-nucleosyl)-tetraphosphatase (symmetrical) YqeK [Bacillales bacterium]
MKQIYYFSSFDPISSNQLDDILKYYKNDDIFHFIVLFSSNASIEHRVNILRLSLRKFNIKYQINLDYTDKNHLNFDFNLFFSKIKIQDDIYLLTNKSKENKLINININTQNIEYKDILDEEYFNHSSYQIRNLERLYLNEVIIDYIILNNLYFMDVLNRYYRKDRLEHSISVAKLSYQIALSNNLDNPDLYFIAGLMHDIGKHIDYDYEQEIMEKHYRAYLNFPKIIHHQFTGVYISKIRFPFIKDFVLDAIKTHTTGDKELTSIQKVIYSADKIEPTRGYDSEYMINECLNDFNKGFILVLKENIKFITAKGLNFNNNKLTNNCIKFYL